VGRPARATFTYVGKGKTMRFDDVVFDGGGASMRGSLEFDPNGDLVAFGRMDGAQLASIAISQHKARTAARYRRPTHAFEDGVTKAGFNYLLTLDDVIASRGGIPLVEGGKLIGAIGCSGGTGSQDETVCTAGANTINK